MDGDEVHSPNVRSFRKHKLMEITRGILSVILDAGGGATAHSRMGIYYEFVGNS
jgi:hypothetical protein